MFDSLSFTLSAAQLVHLTGANGAGKTSLLRMLSGLSQPVEGQILWNGQPLNARYYSELVYIGHKSGLSGNISALDNLSYWCALHGVRSTRHQREEILDELGLVGLESLPVKSLSAGQQRRVALARLWLKPAGIWLLDEPFTALDVQGVQMIEAKVRDFVKQGGIVMLTSHQALSQHAGDYQTMTLEYRW